MSDLRERFEEWARTEQPLNRPLALERQGATYRWHPTLLAWAAFAAAYKMALEDAARECERLEQQFILMATTGPAEARGAESCAAAIRKLGEK